MSLQICGWNSKVGENIKWKEAVKSILVPKWQVYHNEQRIDEKMSGNKKQQKWGTTEPERRQN